MATAPIASAGPEEEFLKYIADHGISWPTDKTQAVCDDWKSGATFTKEVNDLTSVTE